MFKTINDILLKIFNIDEWVGNDILFLDKRTNTVYKSASPLFISDSPNLRFYSFIQPAMGGQFSLHTAIEKNYLKYFRKLNEKEEMAFKAKKMLIE